MIAAFDILGMLGDLRKVGVIIFIISILGSETCNAMFN